MSKRHQASRRRTYGRRQHEIHERTERYVGILGWIDDSDLLLPVDRWTAEPMARAAAGDWLDARSAV
jgi:hypothetical protein